MKIVRDERGAIMVTGLFMAFLLCTATWTILGISRAVLFRERVQETADAAAFSSAVIHAKGMNLIAAINLVFFAVTAVWLTLRIFEHGMYLLQTTVVWNASNCHGHFCHITHPCELGPLSVAMTASGAGGPGGACEIATSLQTVRDANKEARQTVGDGMFSMFPPLSAVQDATARLAPAAGTAASLALGQKYGHFTIAMSPSNLPTDDIVRLEQRIELGSAYQKKDPIVARPLGLPVVDVRFGALCNRATRVAMRKVTNAFTRIPGIGAITANPLVKEVIERTLLKVGSVVENDFCADGDAAGHSRDTKIWKLHGPKLIFGHAENGNDLMQVWAFTRGAIRDVDQNKVAMAATKGRGLREKIANEHQAWYVAQAEMFFDCDGGWGDAQCNGDDNAAFSMRWRARLRRVHAPSFGAELGRYLRDGLFSGPVKEAVRKYVGVTPDQTKAGAVDQATLDGLFDHTWDLANGAVTNDLGVGNQATGALSSEMVH